MKMTVLGGMLVAAVAALGVTGAVVAQDGDYCREYQRKVVIGGKVQDSYGTACMQPDGSWQVAGSDADMAADSVADDLQMASVQPVSVPVYQTQTVYVQQPYYEPVYTDYRYYSAPSFGLNLGWSDHDGRGGRGYHRGGWHGGGHGGHGRH